MTVLPQGRGVLLSSTGMHPDRWCEPTSSARLSTNAIAEVGTALAWIRPDSLNPFSARWGVQVDRDEPFVCELRQDRQTYIGFSVRRRASDNFAVSFSCDHRVTDAGSDKRNLSFILSELSLPSDEPAKLSAEKPESPYFASFSWTNSAELQGTLLGSPTNTPVRAFIEGLRVAEVRTNAAGSFRLPIAAHAAGHSARALKIVAGKTSIEIDVVLDPAVLGKPRAALALPIPLPEDPAHAAHEARSAAGNQGDLMTPALEALAAQTEALRELLSRTTPRTISAPTSQQPSAEAMSLEKRYGALTDLAVNLVGTGQDIIWLGVIDWDFRIQRPQHIATGLARRGCRVFYVSIVFGTADARGRFEILNSPEPGVFEVQLKLHCPLPENIYRELDPQVVAEVLLALDELSAVLSIKAPAVVVQYPSWAPVAFGVPGALVVHDCLDLVSGFDNTPQEIVALEGRLVECSDIVVTTSQPLCDRLARHRSSTLIRNGAEVEFFARAAARQEQSPYQGKVIGYFGAIAHWFEVEWIVCAAQAHPEWTFVLVGDTTGADICPLANFGNVVLLGERPYSELVDHLAQFDVAVIPFKLLDLILCTNPVKFYEYMAAGKPVVASAMPEVRTATDLVYIAQDADDFVSQIERALDEDNEDLRAARMTWAESHGWDVRAAGFCDLLKSASPKVSLVLLSYGDWALTQAALWSVLAFSDYENLEIIVVDNGSDAEIVKELRRFLARDPRIRLVLSETNLGYAAGNNLGIRDATGEYVILLNNDTYVTRGWVRDLIRPLMIDRSVGLVSPLTNNIGNEQRLTIAYANMEEMARTSRQAIRKNSRRTLETDRVAFFCVATRRDVIERVGVLDEAYGLGYFEDDDYCKRVGESGYRVLIVDDVFVHHHLSASFDKLGQPEKQKLMERNKAIFEKRWGTWKPHSYRQAPGFG